MSDEVRRALESCKQHLQLAMDQWSPVRGADEDDDLILKSIEGSLDQAARALACSAASPSGQSARAERGEGGGKDAGLDKRKDAIVSALQAFCARFDIDYIEVEASDLTPFFDALHAWAEDVPPNVAAVSKAMYDLWAGAQSTLAKPSEWVDRDPWADLARWHLSEVTQARGEERERCAKVCDEQAASEEQFAWTHDAGVSARLCATAIRAPGPGVPRRAEDGGGVG